MCQRPVLASLELGAGGLCDQRGLSLDLGLDRDDQNLRLKTEELGNSKLLDIRWRGEELVVCVSLLLQVENREVFKEQSLVLGTELVEEPLRMGARGLQLLLSKTNLPAVAREPISETSQGIFPPIKSFF